LDSRPTGLLLMGHGTRSRAGQEEFLALVAQVRERWQGPVAAGFIELATPTLDDALATLAGEPLEQLIVAPVILLPAGHLKDDGAALARAARRARPDLDVVLAADLGISLELVECLDQRIDAVGMHGAAYLIVGRGATDPAANATLFAITRLLAERRDLPLVDTAFVSLAPPDVPTGLERLSRLGASEIVVAPYFLFRGDLLARIAQQAVAFATSHGLHVEVAAHLGPDPLVLEALFARIEEARGHQVRSNCDTCAWRRPTASPAHECTQHVAPPKVQTPSPRVALHAPDIDADAPAPPLHPSEH
jgi:sirohydrochlorin cobaltochelatase